MPGEYAPISEIVDFILAAQIAENLDRETDNMPSGDAEKNKVWIQWHFWMLRTQITYLITLCNVVGLCFISY